MGRMAFLARRRGYRRRYGRSFGRRRRGMRKSSTWGSTAWNLAKKAAAGVVKYYLNPEYKFLDWTNTTISPSSTPEVYGDVSWLAAGTTEITRTGNTVKFTSLQMHFTLSKATAATQTLVRLVLVSDISSNGVAPDWLDVFETASVTAFINKDYGRRFHIIYDKVVTLDTNYPQKVVKVYKKLQHHVKYLDSTASDAALGQGAIYFLVMSNEATNTPLVSTRSRVRFLDN